jgi:hypothetical protein
MHQILGTMFNFLINCNTKKNIEICSRVDQKIDFLNRCSDGRSETVDVKISSKRDRFTIHMLDSEMDHRLIV